MTHPAQEDPVELPRPRWLRFLRRLAAGVARDHIFMSAGAMAYFGFIALFPTLMAAISLVGLFADAQIVEEQIGRYADLLPPGGAELLRGQLQDLVAQHEQTLGLGLAVSLAIFAWGASNGAAALIEALHLVYDEEEERSFLRARGAALLVALLTVAAIACTVLSLVALPHLVRMLPAVETGLGTFTDWMRWVLAAAVIASLLAGIYRFAPSRPLPSWRRVSWGSTVATCLWLAASWCFSVYIEHVGRLQDIYGALGSVVVLLLWLYLGGLAVLIGAEVDATAAWSADGYRASERDPTPGTRGPRHALP